MRALKFFLVQAFVTLAWLFTFGSLAFVILSKGNMLTVLQGWSMDEPFEIEVDLLDEDPE